MAALRGKIKKILSLVSFGVLFFGVIIGISTKEKNISEMNSNLSDDYRSDSRDFHVSNVETNQPKTVCRDFLEENENSLILREYGKAEAVDCLFVGCGGIF